MKLSQHPLDIERERLLVEGNWELIKIYEEKAKKVIERVWEE